MPSEDKTQELIGVLNEQPEVKSLVTATNAKEVLQPLERMTLTMAGVQAAEDRATSPGMVAVLCMTIERLIGVRDDNYRLVAQGNLTENEQEDD